MRIEVLRIGQRAVRDDRVTTHAALVARAFGAERIFMEEVNPQVRDTLADVSSTWGGGFEVELIDSWRALLRSKKGSASIVHLTMYGETIDAAIGSLRRKEKILAVVGAGKVPRDVYELADYNVSIGGQPHSEISALAVFLDRLQEGRQLSKGYGDARRKVLPMRRGKHVLEGEPE
ncbi:uncharacterized protein conserved in archaea [Cenarchaeum symbiosum A]|uniref:tRNA (cytidine(56)-2'-O)-methyltransferase n=1 Tax=Cenarchaeum symbiosum (strain A) TaxID=414004 RepID=TRM56_CENSY|nr:RecName: Full=tRNA (cytidine(56)-2'-O)-methyltransferase; AltName: Full=tRNA ribose 2'-O-methyltransferase aTrm56 [Cenarchaeum symbiosum A]ABK78348.1 uncharacterized protein conserved in archaea [Cenarchaeum symbiosum A]